MYMYRKGSDEGVLVDKVQKEALLKAGWTEKPEPKKEVVTKPVAPKPVATKPVVAKATPKPVSKDTK